MSGPSPSPDPLATGPSAFHLRTMRGRGFGRAVESGLWCETSTSTLWRFDTGRREDAGPGTDVFPMSVSVLRRGRF